MRICCAKYGILDELWGLAGPLPGLKLDAWKGRAHLHLFIARETRGRHPVLDTSCNMIPVLWM